MQLRLEKDLPVLLFALVSASMLASLPQVESAWTGIKEVYGEQDFGLRILREVMLLVLVVYFFGTAFAGRRHEQFYPVIFSAYSNLCAV